MTISSALAWAVGCGGESDAGIPLAGGLDNGSAVPGFPTGGGDAAGPTTPEGTAQDSDASTTEPGPDPNPGPDPDPGPVEPGPAVEHTYTCTAVGTSYSDGFFSLRSFKDKLFAGQFGYGHENKSMLYSYAPWELVKPGLLGISESVCAMREFNGLLYANTESSGDIFRSSDGVNWELVFNGDPSSIGCGLEVFEGFLYAVNYHVPSKSNGQILRSPDGKQWEVVWSGGAASAYVREITSHNGMLHAFYVDEQSGQGHMLTSPNGTNWTDVSTPARFFRGYSWQGSLWMSSTEKYSNGVAGVWRLDDGQPQLVHQVAKKYVTELVAWDNALFAATGDGWKEDSGTSSLLISRDGQKWETVCDFPELTAWSVAVHDNQLYVGTWRYGSGGKVYQVAINSSVDPGPGPGPDPDPVLGCAAISQANPTWEVCESSANHCAGVFNDGAGCTAYCAAAGMVCSGRFGGEPGCQKEPQNPLSCGDENNHQSDWCECAAQGPGPGPEPNPDPDPEPGPVNCNAISAANAQWEVCDSSPTHCEGVFDDGAGCAAFCAAAGLTCTARYGGEPGCSKELQNAWDCDANNGHQSDYCVCGISSEGPGTPLNCDTLAGKPPVFKEQHYMKAVFTKRHNWVLKCYDYAYTAGADEHKACDNEYKPDGSRTGKAKFTFANVPAGAYEVFVGGRHTDNRNPAGALFKVNGKAKIINQKDDSGTKQWDYHGTYCLGGEVLVVLDSTVNSGSDSVFGVRLVPAQ